MRVSKDSFKKFLFYILIVFLIREVFVHTNFGKSADKKGRDFFILVKEKLNGMFNFSTKVPVVDIPEIPKIPRVEVPKVPGTQVPKVDIPDIPIVDIPRTRTRNVGVPKIEIPRTDPPKVPKVDIPDIPKVNVPRVR